MLFPRRVRFPRCVPGAARRSTAAAGAGARVRLARQCEHNRDFPDITSPSVTLSPANCVCACVGVRGGTKKERHCRSSAFAAPRRKKSDEPSFSVTSRSATV